MWFLSRLRSLGWVVFGQPVFYVYMHGPNWIGWKSRAEADICSAMTSVDAGFWRVNPTECTEMILRDFHSVYSVVLFVLYAYLLVQFLQGLFFRYVVFAPVHNSMRAVQKMLALHPTLPALKTC